MPLRQFHSLSAPFVQDIRSALQKFHAEPSGSIDLMQYFSYPGDRAVEYGVRRKVRSARLSVCAVGGTAYAVVDLETFAELTDKEWDALTCQLEYQYQQGSGAEFEVTDIPIGNDQMILAKLGREGPVFCYTEEQLKERQNPAYQMEQTI